MYFDDPDKLQSITDTKAGGEPATFAERTAAAFSKTRVDSNGMREWVALANAYDERIKEIKDAGLGDLSNIHPMRKQWTLNPVSDGVVLADGSVPEPPETVFQKKLEELAQKNPDKAWAIKADRPVDARDEYWRRANRAEQAERNYGGPPLTGPIADFIGGMGAQAVDPLSAPTIFMGPTSRVGQGARSILAMGAKQAAANMMVEAGFQPFIQQWRKEMGDTYGWLESAKEIGMAGAFGFIADAGVRSAYRGGQILAGRKPILDEQGRVTGYESGAKAADRAEGVAAQDRTNQIVAAYEARNLEIQKNLEALPKDTFDRIAQGDDEATIAFLKAVKADEDPSVGGAINALRNTDRVTLDGIDDGWRERSLIQQLRALEDPSEPAPAHFDAAAKAERPRLADDAELPKGTEGNQHYRMLDLDGKPVRFEAVDANRITTDPATFQFKGGRDSAGASNALRAVDFDGRYKGKVIVYEREDGSLVVADGHDRVSLANRAPEPQKLDALVFREKDGWTAEQVRAEAARKNIQEGTGSLMDVAGAIRRHPEIVDDSMAVSTDFMADARSIARLSDEAFDAVAGGQFNPKHGVLVSDHVPDQSRHMEVLRELDRRNPPTEAAARREIGNMLREPANIETLTRVMDIPLAEPHVLEARNDVLAGVMTTLRQEPGYIGEIETQAIAAVIRRLAEKPGLVSDTLAQAGRAVAEGQPLERAIDATLRRFEDVIGKAGVKGLADQPVRLASISRGLDMRLDRRFHKHSRDFTDDDIEAITSLANEGHSYTSIALETGIPRESVVNAVRGLRDAGLVFSKEELERRGIEQKKADYGAGKIVKERDRLAREQAIARREKDAAESLARKSEYEAMLHEIARRVQDGERLSDVWAEISPDGSNGEHLVGALRDRGILDVAELRKKQRDEKITQRNQEIETMLSAGSSIRSVAESIGVSADTVRSVAAARGIQTKGRAQPQPNEVRDAVASMVKDGLSYAEIQRALPDYFKTRSAVAGLIHRMRKDAEAEGLILFALSGSDADVGRSMRADLDRKIEAIQKNLSYLDNSNMPGVKAERDATAALLEKLKSGEVPPLSLTRTDSAAGILESKAPIMQRALGRTHFYNITADGVTLGDFAVTVAPIGSRAFIESIHLTDALRAYAGTSLLRQLRTLFHGEFPQVTTFYGDRSTGAHAKSGKPRQEVNWPGRRDDSGLILFALSGSDADVGKSMRADLDRLGYYSKALEAAKSLKQAKGTPEQMLAQLKAAGVKDAEIEATNLRGFLDGKTSITRDEIVKHLTEHRVGVNESKYGGAEPGRRPFESRDAAAQYAADIVGADGYVLSGNTIYESRPGIIGNRRGPLIGTIDDLGGGRFYLAQGDRLSVNDVQRSQIPDDATGRSKWINYSLDPSNPTYRETVLHLPESQPSFEQFLKARQDAGMAYPDPSPEMLARYRAEYDAGGWRGAARGQQEAWRGAADSTFRSGHFSEPNIIGHMMTSLNKYEGKPVFTLDQIQSDWGQKIETDTREALAQRLFGKRFKELSPDDRKKVSAAKQQGDKPAGVRDEAKIAELKAKVAEAESGISSAFEKDGVNNPFSFGMDRSKWPQSLRDAQSKYEMATAELRTAEAFAPGHPLVNTTDQWTNTTLRRALRQAVEADAEFIAIPHGDTVLSYNPGDDHGMLSFYGTRTETGIVPKNLRNILQKIDKSTTAPFRVEKIEASDGLRGWKTDSDLKFDKSQTGFTLFPLTDKVKKSILEEGQPLFAKPAENITPTKIAELAENLRQALDEATTPPPGRLDDPIKDAPKQVERLREDLAEDIAVAMGQPSPAQLAALRSAERAKAVLDRASQMKAFAPGFSLRNLFDPQMKTPGNIGSEPFNIADVVIKSRSITEIPVKAIKTVQDTVSLDVVKRMIDNPSTEVPSVFKFGGEYFINDGNHRITAAKARGLDNIKAEVIEIEDRSPVTAGSDNAAAQLTHTGGDHPGHAAGAPLDGADRLVSIYERYLTQGREALDAVMPGTGRMIDEFVQANPEVVARIAEALGAPTGRPQAAQMLEQAMPQFMSPRIIDMSKPVLLTPEANARMPDIRRELDRTVQMLPPEYRIRVEDSLVFNFGDGDKRLDGLHDGYEKLIYVSMAAGDPVRTSRHEVIHALRQSGLMKDEEFAALYKFADRLGLRKAYEIDAQYKEPYTQAYGNRGADFVEQLLREETVANMFSDYSLNGRRFGDVAGGGMVDRLIDMIVTFMKQVRDIMGGYGFRNVYDVFESIESGAMARRGMGDAPEASRLAIEDKPFARDLADVQRDRDAADLVGACRA